MRLAYLDPHPVPDDTPEALQILYTVDALAQEGVDITLITPRSPRGQTPADILARPLTGGAVLHPMFDPRRRWWFPTASNRPFYFFAVRALRDLHPDVVLARNLRMAEYLLRRVPNIRLIFETHEIFTQTYREEHPQPGVRERRKLEALEARERLVYRDAAGLIALTPLLLDDIRRTYGVTTPAVVAPDGVDLQQAQKGPIERAPNRVPMLLYLGSLHPWKGVETLILAMKHVSCPAALTIVGGNSQRIVELRALAESEGVAERVVFAGAVEPARRFD